MKYVIIGSALSGNKGAASMLEAAVQSISQKDSKAEFTLLSMYPIEDRELNTYSNLKIIDGKPKTLGLVINPLSLAYKFVPFARKLLKKNKAVRALSEADVLLDQGGVTFVDGREKFLIYNIATILPAILMGIPVVKCSQALGSFENRVNRLVASFFLPKIERIFCRGQKTYNFVQQISPDNSVLAADLAFSLELSPPEAQLGKSVFEGHKVGSATRHIGVFPSQVLRTSVDGYDAIMAGTVDKLVEQNPDLAVYVIPHSQRADNQKLHNNDNPVCEAVYRLVGDKSRVSLVDEYISPQAMRSLIGELDFTIAARFHAMVSALATTTPTLVTTWSHKYGEVLDMFDVPECAYKGDEITVSELVEVTNSLLANLESLEKSIDTHIDDVRQSSISQIDEIVSIASRN